MSQESGHERIRRLIQERPGSRRPRRGYRPGSQATASCVANGAGDWWEESVRPVGTATSCRESKKKSCLRGLYFFGSLPYTLFTLNNL
jgi:hypothetical protein